MRITGSEVWSSNSGLLSEGILKTKALQVKPLGLLTTGLFGRAGAGAFARTSDFNTG